MTVPIFVTIDINDRKSVILAMHEIQSLDWNGRTIRILFKGKRLRRRYRFNTSTEAYRGYQTIWEHLKRVLS